MKKPTGKNQRKSIERRMNGIVRWYRKSVSEPQFGMVKFPSPFNSQELIAAEFNQRNI